MKILSIIMNAVNSFLRLFISVILLLLQPIVYLPDISSPLIRRLNPFYQMINLYISKKFLDKVCVNNKIIKFAPDEAYLLFLLLKITF